MNKSNKELINYISDIKRFETEKTEITIVGGVALDIYFPEASIVTYDLDVLTNNEDISRYGVSTQVNQIKSSYGEYKKDRVLLEQLSNETTKTFVLGKERLIATKLLANRPKDRKHIEIVKENYDKEINWDKVNKIKTELEKIISKDRER